MRTKKIVAVLLVLCMMFGIMPAALASGTERFVDFPTGWSAPAMTAAVNNGLLVGVSDTEIQPEAYLTRAELATIIARAFGAETTADISNFADVSPSAWYYDYISKAVKMEVLKGKSDTQMDPDAFITREEVFTALARVLVLSSSDSSSLDRFKDKGSISDWALPELSEMSARRYINGDDTGNLNPTDNITREEFAQVMYNTIKTYITSSGVFDGSLEGITVVRAGNVTLKDAYVTGDLVIGDGAGVGAINIQNTEISGRLLTRGGTMTLKSFKIGEGVVVKNVNGVTNFNNYRTEFDKVVEHTPAKFLTQGGGAPAGGGTGGGTGGGDSNSCTITVVNPSGSQIITVTRGQTPDLSTTYTVPNGYTHSGNFYYDRAKTRLYTPAPISGNLVLYPDLTPITYTITYVLPVGATLDGREITTYTVETQSIVLPTAANITISDPTKEFKGWFKDAGYTYGPYTTLNPSDCTNVTLYAKVVTQGQVNVYFRKNFGDTTIYASYTIPENGSLTSMPADPPAETGYQFSGWYINREFNDESKRVTLSTTFSGDTDVYAKFTPIPYTIGYVLPTGSSLDGTETTSYNIETAVTLPVAGNVTVPLGYEFGGWYDNASFTGTEITNIAVGTTGNKTYYAKVTPVPYTISYVLPTGSSLDGSETIGYDILTAVTLPVAGNVTVPLGYEFGGWYDNASFTGTEITNIAVGTIGNKTFYGKVTPIQYSINYVLPVGTTLDGSEDTYYDIETAVTLPVAGNVTVPLGFEFKGWFADASFTGTAITEIPVGTTGIKTYYAKVEMVDYSINYVLPAVASLDGTEITSYNIATSVILPLSTAVTVDAGYEFKGWYDNQELTGSKQTSISIGTTGNKTYYASVTPVTYTIEYVLPSGTTLDGTETLSFDVITSVVLPTASSLTVPLGYEFKGWYDNSEFTGSSITNISLGATGNKTFYAKVTPISYSISYELPSGTTLDGSEITSYDILTGVTLPLSTSVSVPVGYEFKGWYDNSEFAGSTVTGIPVGTTGNKTFYAKVTPIPYSISYELPTGSSLDGSETKEYNITTGVTLPQASSITTPLGYEFKGWYDNAGYEGSVITNIAVGTTGNKTFYALVEPISYSITYELPSGTTLDGSEITSYDILTGVTLPLSTSVSVPVGYEFKGWYDNSEFAGNAVTGIPVGTTGNKTFYAKVTPIPYSISYELPTGSSLDGSETKEYNITTGVTLPKASSITTPLGYEFKGWYENSEFTGSAVTEIPIGTTGNKTYYAWVEIVTYQIDYNCPVGSSLDGTEITEYNVNTAVTLPGLNIDTGFEFGGWYDNASFTGSTVTGIPVGTTGNKTFYAKVTPISYSISYELPTGSSLDGSETKEYNVTIGVTLPQASSITTPLGYEFKGWYDNAGYEGSVITNIAVGTTGNKTYYALVKPIQYSITYKLPTGSSLNVTPITSYNIETSATLPVTDNVTVPLGYEFLGWYENSDYSGNAVTEIPVGTTGNKTYYGKVTLIPYSINYQLPEGITFNRDVIDSYTIIDAVTLPSAETLNLPLGYEFLGWYEVEQTPGEAQLQAVLTADDVQTIEDEEQPVTGFPQGTTGHKFYYPKIQPITYSITYVVPTNSSLDGKETTSYNIETAVTLPGALNITVPFGYEFKGWYETSDFKGSNVTGISVGTIGNKTYYACVLPIPYSITYVLPSGSRLDGTEAKSYNIETAVTLPTASNVVMPKGYEFKGWHTDAGFTSEVVTNIAVGVTGNKTYYANITAIPYTIEYDFSTSEVTGVDFKEGITPTTGYIVTDTVTLPVADHIDIPDGYKFMGWYYNNNLTDGPVDEFTGKVPATGTVLTLYARVIPVDEYTVYFRLELDDTQNYAMPTVRENESLDDRMPEDPEKEGSIFGGWYIDGDFDDETKKFDKNTIVTGDTYVYAKWNSELYTVRFIQGAAELKKVTDIPYNTKFDKQEYWEGLPDAPEETIYMKLSSYSDFVYPTDTPFKVADVYYYQDDNGEWKRFDESVVITKNIDAYLMDKRFSMTIKIPSREAPFGPDTPYVAGETRIMDSLKSILSSGSDMLNILEDTDTFKKAENKITQQLIDKDIVVKHANGDLEIKIIDVPVNVTRFITSAQVKSIVKQYITDMVNDPDKLDSVLGMIDIDGLVDQIGVSTLVGRLSDAKIVELMKKQENRTTVINGVYSALSNESMKSVIISYLTERIENDKDFCEEIATEFKKQLASDASLRAQILGDTTLLDSVLGQESMKTLVADVILGDDVLEIAVSNSEFKAILIEKMATNADVRAKVSATPLFKAYVLDKVKSDGQLKAEIREKLATDADLRDKLITNEELLNALLGDETLKDTIISSAVDNDVFIEKVVYNDELKESLINKISENQDFFNLLLDTDAFSEFVVDALHSTNSPFKAHVLELLEEESVKADMHEIIKDNDDFRAELESDELKKQVLDAIDEYISHDNVDDLVAYIWHRTLGDTYTGGYEADYQNFITDEMVEEFKDVLYDHRPDEAIGWTPLEFFDYLTSNSDAREDVKASADADVREKIDTELTQYKEDVLADFVDDGVITNPDGTENLDVEGKIDDAILEIIKTYIKTETTGNANADTHIEHEMVEYTRKIVTSELDGLHQDIVEHVKHIKEDFKASIIDIDNDILVQSIQDFRDESSDNKTIIANILLDNYTTIIDYVTTNISTDGDLKTAVSNMLASFAPSIADDHIDSLIEKIGDDDIVITNFISDYIDGLTPEELKEEINDFVSVTPDADILDMVKTLRDDSTLGLKGVVQEDEIYNVIKDYLVNNIENGTIKAKVDNVLMTKASSIDNAVICDLILKLLGDPETSGMVTDYLSGYVTNPGNEITVRNYINSFIESDSLNEQFVRDNRQLIEDIINSIDISGMITNDLIKEYISGLTPDEKEEFIDDVYSALNKLSYFGEFVSVFDAKGTSFEIRKDNLALIKAVAEGIEGYTYDTVIEYIKFPGFDRIEALLGDRFAKPLFDKAKADYLAGLNDAIAEVEADNTKVINYTTSMTFKVDIVNDVLIKLYDKATEEAVERLNKIDGIHYDKNDYLYSLVEYNNLLTDEMLEYSTHPRTEELSGWLLRTPTEYYDVALGKVILLDDAICWYGDELTEQQIDAMVSAALDRGFDVHDKINEIVSDYDLYHTLPDSVQKVIDRVSQLNSFINKYQSQIDAVVDKYLSSGLNQKFEEEDVMNKDKVDSMIDIIFGTEDEPIFNIDSMYILLDKANVELRGKVHQKLLDNETRIENAIKKFESTDIGTLLSSIGNSKVTSLAEKADEFLATGKISSAYDNVYDILLHITDPEIGPDAYSFTVEDPTIKGVDDAYKFSIRGIEFKFMRYFK